MHDPLAFPDPRFASRQGLVAVGGDFRPERLLAAYFQGIFPWPSEELPHGWFCPDPRLVLLPEELHVSRSLEKVLRRKAFKITWDRAFPQVISHCSTVPRPGQAGTWISPELVAGFLALHRMGYAHSVEAWSGDRLVGGVYGIALGKMFCGESMFHLEPDASKVAFVHLVRRLAKQEFQLIDCQVYTQHMARLGAREWPRDEFLDALETAVAEPALRGSWGQAALSIL